MAYTTTTPNDIDFVYKLPENEMLQAIQTSDQQIDKANDQTDAFDKYINSIKSLPANQGRLQEIAGNYRNQITSVRDTIAQDPANYRQHLGKIRGLSRNIQNDEDLKTMQTQYDNYQKWLTDNKDADPTLLDAYKNHTANQGGYDPTTKSYSNLNLPQVSKTIDWAKKAKEWQEGAKPISKDNETELAGDINEITQKVQKNNNGDWLVKQGGKLVYMSPERVQQIWQDSKNSDLEAKRWVEQANNVLPPKYTLAPNTNYQEDNGVTPRMIAKPIGAGDYMSQLAERAAIGKFAYKETTSKRSITRNPIADELLKENWKHDEHMLERKEKLDDQAHKDEIDKQKNISDHLDDLNNTDEPGKQKAAQEWFKTMGIDPKNVQSSFVQAQMSNPAPSTTLSAILSTGRLSVAFFNLVKERSLANLRSAIVLPSICILSENTLVPCGKLASIPPCS